jgi:hypothetical protein
MGYGVIGNTTVSGTVILGSSPGIPALNFFGFSADIQVLRIENHRFGTKPKMCKTSLA